MRCLLDTHILLWWMTKPKILSPGMRDFLDDRSNELLLSVVTPWEIAIKTNSGKLDGHPVLRKIESSQLNEDVRILRTEISQVIRAGLLPSYHRDPFDRLLAAQALELGIPIISKDGIFDLYGVRRIWH
jgi:PIN domain nuclease of toxin-antitoxin system